MRFNGELCEKLGIAWLGFPYKQLTQPGIKHDACFVKQGRQATKALPRQADARRRSRLFQPSEASMCAPLH